MSKSTVQMHGRSPLFSFGIISVVALCWPLGVSAATIRGQVVGAATGLPLPRAVIILRSSDSSRGVRSDTTDGQGRYEFNGLTPGQYDLSVTKTGYVSLTYSQTRAPQAVPLVELRADNDVRDQIDFKLIRAGAVTGRISDDFGEPLEARISAQRFEFVAGLRRLVPVGRPAQSNDLGEFRVYGLPPGQYYLGAATSYAPTYFPGTVNPAEAQPITIGEGQEVTNIGIAILPIRTARISGTATDLNGRSMSGATVMALQGGMGSGTGRVSSDGTFSVADLAPGEYTIKVSRRLGDGQEVASAAVSINGEDVTGLTLIAQKPALVRGRLIVEAAGGGDPSRLDVGALRVHALRASPEETVAIGISSGAVDSQGTFEVTAPPGATLLRFATLPTGWQLKAVRLNGLDVTDSGLDLPSDQTLDGVELVVSNRQSGISGMVTDGFNRTALNYSVVIFPEDRRQWNFQSRYLMRCRPGQAGRFNAMGLPPGKYLAIAVDSLAPGEELDPAFLERALARATRFSLLEGETRTADLRLQTFP